MDGLLPDVVHTIPKPQVIPDELDVEISDVEYVASYTWLDTNTPTIAVPGSPRLWSPPALPAQVVPDRGRTFVDQNGFRLGAHALAPLFAAADALGARTGRTPGWGTVDVVTDRNNLLKLLGWLDAGCAKRKHRGAFRIDVALAGAWTLLLRRWEERTAVSSDGTGFGDGFERRCSKDALGGSERGTLAGHCRVVTYDFAGLKMVVRCEVDAYRASKEASVDALTEQLSSLNMRAGPAGGASGVSSIVSIRHAGTEVAQSSLVKIKSRSRASKAQYLENAYLQLLLGQLPELCLGVHDGSGVFDSINSIPLDSERFRNAREKARPALRKLRRLLEEIQSLVMQRGVGAQLSLVCSGGELLLMQRTAEDALLPPVLMRRFTT
ncbi:hypothetical protein PsYK624_086860 [Phanerochaete sordida]|uniref:Uncharacterized protein n=1 Tax=Phanerochaete sordida TaxID=48140 RepID=A0A9P3LFZ0_9APHY|nr:hypothetical protein PsYK624_086860 [Phanerochaete sordida]